MSRFLKPQYWIIFIALILLGIILSKKQYLQDGKVIESDVIEYYAYLPAVFIYKDIRLNFVDTYKGPHKFTIWVKKLENNNKLLMTSAGLAYLYSPFFITAHISAKLLGYDTGGYSMPYRLALLLCTWVWLIIGLFVLFKLLSRYFPSSTVIIALLTLVFGTNILWYTCFEAPLAHVYGFSLTALFIYLTIKWHENPNVRNSILVGLLTGLISLIRPTNIIIVLFFVLYGISSIPLMTQKLQLLLRKFYLVIIMAVCSLLVWVPQMIYWKTMTGHYFYYSYGDEEGFFWSNPHIIEGLFGYRKGWLLYTPVMSLAIIGIFFLRKKLKEFFLPVLVFLPVNIYIVLSWWCWWYGGGFGLRGFVDSYALLAFPLAAFIAVFMEKSRKYFLLPVLGLFIFHNVFMITQALHGVIHYDSMTSRAYWAGIGRTQTSPQVTKYMEQPDYNMARKGVAASSFYPGYIHSWMMFAMKPYALLPTNPHDSLKPYTLYQRMPEDLDTVSPPAYTVQLDASHPFGLNYSIVDVLPYDIFKIYVKRKQSLVKANMVCSDEEGAKYVYASSDKGRPIPGTDWELIGFTVSIPPEMKGKPVRLYAWNPSKDPVDFGDLYIVRIQAGF